MSLINDFKVNRQIVVSNEVVNRNYRLDPSQYSEESESITRHMKEHGIKFEKIREQTEVKEVYLPNRFTRNYIKEGNSGKPLLGTSNMLMLKLPTNSRIGVRENTPLLIKPGDILVSRSGTIGTTVLCGSSYEGFVASDDCLRVRISENLRGFVTAYLKSSIGQTLLIRDGHGKVIRHLKEQDIINFQIPIFDKEEMKKINDLMNKSVSLLDEVRKLLKEAEINLFEVIGIDQETINESTQWINKSNNSFIKASNSLFNDRLDPHINDPGIENLLKVITTIPHKPLGEIADIWHPGRFTRKRAERGYGVPFYSSGDIMKAERKTNGTLSKTILSKIEKCYVDRGTTLICRSGAYGGVMGRAMFVSDAMDKWAISEHMVRCKLFDTNFLPEFLFGYLGSTSIGYSLATSLRHGKDVPEIEPNELGSIPVPVISIEKQKKVADPVKEAFQKQDIANDLEQQAISCLLKNLKWEQ